MYEDLAISIGASMGLTLGISFWGFIFYSIYKAGKSTPEQEENTRKHHELMKAMDDCNIAYYKKLEQMIKDRTHD